MSLYDGLNMAASFFGDETVPEGAADTGVAGSIGGILGLVWGLIVIIGLWRVFTKAGQPGWASLVPIYNAWVLLKIVGRPGWWLVALLVPVVNVIFGLLLCIDLAKSFGKGSLYGLGLAFFSAIFTVHLGLGDARYGGPSAA